MIGDDLRQAAASIREKAALAAATGAWDWRSKEGATWWAQGTRAGEYIQAWHPEAALAVADWLDAEAGAIDMGQDDNWPPQLAAMAVARAYLREAAA